MLLFNYIVRETIVTGFREEKIHFVHPLTMSVWTGEDARVDERPDRNHVDVSGLTVFIQEEGGR